MSWRTAQNVDDLKNLPVPAGAKRKLDAVKAMIRRDIEASLGRQSARLSFKCTAPGWSALLNVVREYLALEAKLTASPGGSAAAVPYFQSEQARAMFALLELDSGPDRSRILGITDDLYRSQEKAKAWRNRILRLVAPDHNPGLPGANEAAARLAEIYGLITR
jgi:hypothetical protein